MKRLIPALLAILAVAAFAQTADAPDNRIERYIERLETQAEIVRTLAPAFPEYSGYFYGKSDGLRAAADAIRAWEAGVFPPQ